MIAASRRGILGGVRGAALVSVVLAVAIVAGWAAAATRTDALIRPGVGIGKARLGMTDAQVRRALGRPIAQRRSRSGFGRLRVEYQYEDGFLLVRLAGRATALRVTGVSTIKPWERTANGVGPGVRKRILRGRYGARLRCERLRRTTHHPGIPPRVAARKCTLPAGRSRTVFLSDMSRESYGEPVTVERFLREARIREVTVETR
jgi:hypothetical protein